MHLLIRRGGIMDLRSEPPNEYDLKINIIFKYRYSEHVIIYIAGKLLMNIYSILSIKVPLLSPRLY